jgi:hypothetical protein
VYFLCPVYCLYLYYYWASDLDHILLGEIPVLQRIVKLENEDEEKSTKGLIMELLPGGKRVREGEHLALQYLFSEKDDALSFLFKFYAQLLNCFQIFYFKLLRVMQNILFFSLGAYIDRGVSCNYSAPCTILE